MKDRMAGIWHPLDGILIRELEAGLYMFQFYHHVDVQRVLKGGPWSFDKNFLILTAMVEGVVLSQLPLFVVLFWIQVLELPPGFMSKAVGKILAACLGKFLEYDAKNASGTWRSYMHLRVLLDLCKPLLRTKKIWKEGGAPVVVSFKYEKLGSFYYLCGMLGHINKFCPLLLTLANDKGDRGWGPELRAEPRASNSGGGARWLQENPVPGGINGRNDRRATRYGKIHNFSNTQLICSRIQKFFLRPPRRQELQLIVRMVGLLCNWIR